MRKKKMKKEREKKMRWKWCGSDNWVFNILGLEKEAHIYFFPDSKLFLFFYDKLNIKYKITKFYF
jgi:hypothetical protein